jgi:hypothetical protein
MNELTLFGKAMAVSDLFSDCDVHWTIRVNSIWVHLFGEAGRYQWRSHWRNAVTAMAGGGPFATPELARDDAELALRELYAALGELIEPWITDRDPPPPACSTCDDAYLCSWDSEYGSLVGEAMWDGTVWYGDGHSILNKPYAWREMPKAPPRKP